MRRDQLNAALNLQHITETEMNDLIAGGDLKEGDEFCLTPQHKRICWDGSQFNTTLIEPTLSTLFSEDWESGDFTAGGWTVVNDTTNVRVVGQADVYDGDYSCYISNDGGTTAAYTNNTTQVSHIYKDITIPASVAELVIRAFWKTVGESGYDYMRVFLAPTTVTPTAGNEVSTTYQIGTDFNGQGAWNQTELSLGNSYSGGTYRLIISWRNDGSVGTNPGGLFDKLLMLYR